MADEITTTTTTFDEATLRNRRKRQRELEESKRKKYPAAWIDPNYYEDPRNAYAATYLTSQAQAAPNPEAFWNRQQIAAQASMLTEEQEDQLLTYVDRGYVDPEMAAAVADLAQQVHLDEETINALAGLDTLDKSMNGEGAPPTSHVPNEQQKSNLSRWLGNATRPIFALASMPVEMTIGAIRSAVGEVQTEGWGGLFNGLEEDDPAVWEQSLGGQWIRGLIDPNYSADLGSGWVPGGEVHARQVAATRDAAPLIGGHAWTIGRGVTSLFIEDTESSAFRNISGFIDLASNVALDPLIWVGAAGAASRAAQAGARGAEALSVGQRAAAELGEEALKSPEAWLISGKDLGAATNYVKQATDDYVKHSQEQGHHLIGQRVAEAEDAVDDAVDRLAFAKSETPHEASDADWISNVTSNLDDEEIASIAAQTHRQRPDLPGVFTDAIPDANSPLVGSMDDLDAIVRVTDDAPVLKSTDDRVDIGELIGVAKGLKGLPKRAKEKAVQTLKAAQSDANEYGAVLTAAEKMRSGGAIGAVLRAHGVDGVTDVFRMKEGTGGVWWLNKTDTAVWGEGDVWKYVDPTEGAMASRVSDLEKARRTASTKRSRVRKQQTAVAGAAKENAKHFGAVMAGKLDVADAPTAVQQAVEYAVGVRRQFGGKVGVDHELVKEFVLGTPKGFDHAAGVRATKSHKLMRAADRAMMGTVTLGTSELLRLARKTAVDPFMGRLRERLFETMVGLDDTPRNLGMLQRLTNGKMNIEAMRGVLKATNENEVLEAIAPHLGIDITRPITPSVMNAGRARMMNVTMERANNHLFDKATRYITDFAERQGTIAPRGLVSLNFSDPQGSAITLRNYLTNIPGMEAEHIDNIIGNYLTQGTEVGRAKQVMAGFDEVFESMVQNMPESRLFSAETREATIDALKQATRLFDGGRAEVNNWWWKRYVVDGKPSVMTMNGEKTFLPGPQLEAELARGGIVLPDIQGLRDAVGRWGQFLQSKHGDMATKIRDVVSAGNDFWRSAVLFRPAYVVRNIGEMQSRMFLTGHQSIFGHPLAVAAFTLASTTKRPAMKALAEKFTKANKTATGFDLTTANIDEMRGMDAALDEFIELMSRSGSRLDMRTHRATEAFHGLEEVKVGQPAFAQGLAEQLVMLRSSRLSRLVAGYDPEPVAAAVARGIDRQDAVVNYISSDAGRHIRQELADSSIDMVKIVGNPRLGVPPDAVALKEYLFTAKGSIAERVNYFTRGRTDLNDFIVTGKLVGRRDKDYDHTITSSDAVEYGQQMQSRTRRLASVLRPIVGEFDPDTKMYMRVLRSKTQQDPFKVFDRTFDWFFNWAGKAENAWSVGPEFAYAYHQKMAQLIPSIQKGQRQQVFDVIKGAEGRLRQLSETMQTARTGMKTADEGALTLEDASAMAAKHASSHVREFFYDAMRRKQIFHAMRVAWPFAQSFFNTLGAWGSLVAAKPYMVEKVGRLGMALSEPGSNIIYDDFDTLDPFTNRRSYDPNQGFLWRDPATDEQMISFPIVGSALATILSPVSGAMMGEPVDMAEAMQFSAPLRNLNIALQGDVDYVPGAGPIITVPSNLFFPDDWFGDAPEWINSYLFPYGRPEYEQGLLESIAMPTWFRRLTGAMYNGEQRQYALKGSMAHLLSTREYSNFRSDPEQAQKLIEDTRNLAQTMAMFRAFGASFLPAAPSQDIYAVDTDGNAIATAYISDRYYHLLNESGYDNEKVINAMAETYGLETLAAVSAPSTEGDVYFSGPAWEFFKANPQRGKAFADVLGYFFPGDYSFEANEWSRQNDSRRRLSEDERFEKVMEFLYFGERRQIEGKAAKEGWDNGATRLAYEELDERYGGVVPTFEIGKSEQNLAKIRRALQRFPELTGTRGGMGAQAIFESYDEYIAEAERRWGPGSTLSSKRAEGLRQSFLRDLDSVAAQYGGFNREEGGVDTIADMFARTVAPEE